MMNMIQTKNYGQNIALQLSIVMRILALRFND